MHVWHFFCTFAAKLDFMDMKRFISSLFLAVSLCLPGFADSYRETLSMYLQSSNVADKEQYQQMLQSLGNNLFPESPEQGDAILAEYITTQMPEDMTDMFLPAFRKHVSEEELNELVATLSDPRYSEILQRTTTILNNVNQSVEFQEFVNQYQVALMQILQGQSPANIPVPASISKDYQQTFMQYYYASRADDILMSSFRSMTSMLTDALRKQGYEHPEQTMEELIQYTQRNIPIVLLSSFYKVLTIQDLQTLTQLTETPAYRHAMDAAAEVVSDPLQLGLALLTKMSDWMYLHFPQYSDSVQKLIDQLKSSL